MKRIYVMMGLTIIIFILSFDILFYTNVYADVIFVVIYLLFVGQAALDLKTDVPNDVVDYSLSEKKTTYFAPMIFMPFLGITVGFGLIAFVINILLIILLYVYVILVMKRNNITVSKEGISVVYLNNKKDFMLFSEVEKVKFNWFYNYIELSNEAGRKLILDITLKDFLVVIRILKEHLPSEMIDETFKKLSNFYSAFLVTSNKKYLKINNK